MNFPDDFGDFGRESCNGMAGAMSAHSPSLAARGALTGACRGVDFSNKFFIERSQDISHPVYSSCILWITMA